MSNELTKEEVRSLFNYNPETGELTWNINTAQIKAGTIAGSYGKNYKVVTVNGKTRNVHTIIWLWMTGKLPIYPYQEIDHKDKNGFNNIWSNLRIGTSQQNKFNSHKRNADNKYKGVTWDCNRGKYAAKITIDYKTINLGRFDSAEEAHEAYKAAALKYHGEFASF